MIIGIGGVSRAGKTSLALQIQDWVGEEKVKILHQDDYIQPTAKMPKIKGHIDWEHPDSIDFKRLIHDIEEFCDSFQIIIVEGLMAFWNEELTNLMQKKIYLEIKKEAFLNRKTLDSRWENEPDWYIEHIWKNHFIYGLLPGGLSNILQLDGEIAYAKRMVKTYLEIE